MSRIETRNHRTVTEHGPVREYRDATNGTVIAAHPSTSLTYTAYEARCPDCGSWFGIVGLLQSLAMTIGSTCAERHRERAKIE